MPLLNIGVFFIVVLKNRAMYNICKTYTKD